MQCRRPRFDPWFGKIPRRRKWKPIPVILLGEHGQRSPVGYSPWGHKESNMTEPLTLMGLVDIHTYRGFPGGSDGKEYACSVGNLGLIPALGRSPDGGHGNPLQYSCLDKGAWRATVHGVPKSWTQPGNQAQYSTYTYSHTCILLISF